MGAGRGFVYTGPRYRAVEFALRRRRGADLGARTPQPRAKGQLREGWSFARRSPLHRTVLVCNAIVGCLAFNYPLFYSSLVKLSLHASPSVFGAAETINAVTAVGGGLWLGRRLSAPTTRTYAVACGLLGLSLSWSAAAPNTFLFLAGMPYFGFVVVLYITVSQSLVQGATPPHLVGRIMTLFSLGVMGTTPIGALISGALTDAVSPRAAIGLGAVALLGCGAFVAMRHREPLGAAPCEPDDAALVPALAGES
jgi:MFS family permease